MQEKTAAQKNWVWDFEMSKPKTPQLVQSLKSTQTCSNDWNESGDKSNAGNWPGAPPPLFDPGRLFQERFAQDDDSSTDGSGSKSGDSNWADGETLPPSWIPTENWKRLPTTTFNTTWVYLGTGALTPPDKHSSILSIILDALAGLECG